MLGLLLMWMLPGLNGLYTGGVHHDEFLSWQRSFGKQDEYVRLNESDLNSRFAGSPALRDPPRHMSSWLTTQSSRQILLQLWRITRATSPSRSP